MKKKTAFWIIVILILIIGIFQSGTCKVYQMNEKFPEKYDFDIINADKQEFPNTDTIETRVTLVNLEQVPGTFTVQQEVRTEEGVFSDESTLSLVPGTPKSYYARFNVPLKDVMETSFLIIAPQIDVIKPTYKFVGCGN